MDCMDCVNGVLDPPSRVLVQGDVIGAAYLASTRVQTPGVATSMLSLINIVSQYCRLLR